MGGLTMSFTAPGNLRGFLAAFQDGLDCFARRIADQNERDRAVIMEPKSSRGPGGAEVRVGTGSLRDGYAPLGILLNNKPCSTSARVYRSVTELVLHAPEEVINHWTRIAGEDQAPQRFFARFNVVLEDVSPDSCFALFCLLSRWAGLDIEEELSEWVAYVERWEAGETLVADTVFSSYGCLHNALVHGNVNHDIARACLDGLAFMLDVLRSGALPGRVPESIASPTVAKARAMLA